MPTVSKTFSLPFIRKEKVAKDTFSFYFDRSANPTYEFSAGQYTRVLLDLSKEDPRGRSRMFTTTSSPQQKDFLIITTKITTQTSIFKQKLMNLNRGEEVTFFGPMGGFVLPEKNERPLIFLAGGIGVTPFYSMLLHAKDIKYFTPITIFVSFSTVEEILYYDTLNQLSKENPYIKVIYTISRPKASEKKWNGEVGRISIELIKKHVPDILGADYFIAGPTNFVGGMLDLLDQMHIPPDHIFEEQLTGY